MSSIFTSKFLVAGLILASVLVFGTIYATAQDGPSADVIFSEEITLQGSIVAVDDQGFTMIADGVTYYVHVPSALDKADLGIIVDSDITVTGSIAECPNNVTEYTMYRASSINGIVIEHDMQAQIQAQSQDKSGECDGSGSGDGKSNGPNYNYSKGK